MNRVYKTKWSAAHQQYVVTDEHHATKGKAAKSTLAIAVASIMMATGAQAAYMEPGFVAENSTQVTEAQKSFEPEGLGPYGHARLQGIHSWF